MDSIFGKKKCQSQYNFLYLSDFQLHHEIQLVNVDEWLDVF